jgi:GMP reductase
MRIISETKLDFDDVLITPKRSVLATRKDVKLERSFKTRNGNHINGIPIIASNMATGNFNMLSTLAMTNMFTAIAKHHNADWYNLKDLALHEALFNGFYTIGMNETEAQEMLKFADYLKAKNEHMDGQSLDHHLKICVDVANGYSQKFADYIHDIRGQFPKNVLMAGNVCTPEMTQELILAGADIVKIGIGPGSECTTRLKTGCGYPQISAAIECADVAHGLDALICLDGGMTCPGDIAKAFCANADFVMLGGMFAGTDECDGELITKVIQSDEFEVIDKHTSIEYRPKFIEKKYKQFYGMSSEIAPGNLGKDKDYATSEGRVEEIEYKGPVANVVTDILGGLRSACTYIGANELKNMGKCGTFIKVTRQHKRF